MIAVHCELPNSRRGDFYLNDVGSVVCALVLTRKRQVVLTEQYRLGPGAVMRELPGGKVERGELPRHAIAREVLEETGYQGKVRYIVTSNDDAWSRKKRYHFVITEAEKVAQPADYGFEPVKPVLMSLKDFRQHLRSGKLTDVETGYLGLDFLKLL